MAEDNGTKRRRYGKMSRIRMKETSGVDHPAHLEEGWMVMKNAEGLEELVTEAEEVLKDVGSLLDALESSSFLADAPDIVKRAALILDQYLRSLTSDGEFRDPTGPGSKEEMVAAARDKAAGSDLEASVVEQVEKALTDLGEFLLGPDEETIRLTVDDEEVEVTGVVKKRKGIARRRLTRLQSAVDALKELFDDFTAEEVAEAAEAVANDEITEEAEVAEEKNESTTEVEAAAETQTEAVAEEAVAKSEETSESTSEMSAIAKAIEDLSAKVSEVSESLSTKIDEVTTRVEAVEKAKTVKVSMEGQDDAEVQKDKGSEGWGLFPR